MNNNDVVLSRLGVLEEVSSEIFEEASEDELDQRTRELDQRTHELDQRERNIRISLSDAQRFYNDLKNIWDNDDYEDILDYLEYEFSQQNDQSHRKEYKKECKKDVQRREWMDFLQQKWDTKHIYNTNDVDDWEY